MSFSTRSSDLRIIAGVPVRIRKSISKLTRNNVKASPEKGKSNPVFAVSAQMKRKKRVSCRDLGSGDCEGWLWKKKSNSDRFIGGALSTKWVKRWVVIKDGGIYCYRSSAKEDSDQRAECYISLPGYQVTPSSESKRKFAFCINHINRKTFFFAAERQMDMSRWMNKMGLVAIEYKYDYQKATDQPENSKDENYYSESDEDDGFLDDASSVSGSSSSPRINSSKNYRERKARKPAARTQTMGDLRSEKTRGNRRDRFKSASIRREDTDSGHCSLNEPLKNLSVSTDDKLLSLPPSSSNITTMALEDRKQHLLVATRLQSHLSRSLDSVQAEKPSEQSDAGGFSGLLRSQEIIDKKEEEEERKAKGLVPTSFSSDFLQHPSPNNKQNKISLMKSASFATPHNSEANICPNDSYLHSQPKRLFLSSPTVISKYSNVDVSSSSKAEDSPTTSKDDNSSQASTVDTSQMPVEADIGKSEEEVTEDNSLEGLCKHIKEAEVDVLGRNRRTTMRRKMTVLSADPDLNEKMLRKRALERELKAKELELDYFNKLLKKGRVMRADLHAWINQHPSLVAELGTIRRLSKKQRPPVIIYASEPSPLVNSREHKDSLTSLGSMSGSERETLSLIVEANSNNSNNANFSITNKRQRLYARSHFDSCASSDGKTIIDPFKNNSVSTKSTIHCNTLAY